MESSAPVSSSPSQEKPEKKFLPFGIGVGIGYGLLTPIFVFPIAFIISITFIVILDTLIIEVNESIWDKFEFDVIMSILGILSLLISLLFGGIAGFFSGRSAYRSANESGSIRNAGFGVLSCSVVGLIGFLVFPLLFVTLYLAFILLVMNSNVTIENPIIGFLIFILLGGSESGAAAMFVVVIPTLGIFTAYIVAMISGAVTHRILARRSAASKKNIKIEEGVS